MSPTDALAPAVIMRRLDAPRRLMSTVEGEGLFNDATALVAYRVAVSVVVAGTFSLVDAGVRFVLGAAGGVAVGWIVAQLRKWTPDDQVNVTMSLLTGYAAFVPADAIGASGVLAAVTAGIFMGVRGPRILQARSRLQGYFVWDILDFLVNAVLFVLIGLQLRAVIEGLSGYSGIALLGYAVGVSAVVIVTRSRGSSRFLPYPCHRPQTAATQEAGIGSAAARDRVERDARRRVARRGAGTPNGHGHRPKLSAARSHRLPYLRGDLLHTLVVQGLSLPALINRLDVSNDVTDADEELRARLVAAKATLDELDVLAGEAWLRRESIERLRAFHEYRKRRFAARAGKIEDAGYEDQTLAYQRTVHRVLAAQRQALLQMRRDGGVSNEAMNRVLRELDLEKRGWRSDGWRPMVGQSAGYPPHRRNFKPRDCLRSSDP